MLLGLAVFFVLVFLFYITFSMSNVKNVAAEKSRDDAVLLAVRLAGSPEFNCVGGVSEGSAVCVDTDKVMALLSHPEYKQFWDVNSLRIEKVYPSSDKTILCSLGDYPNCNTFNIISNKSSGVEEYSSFVVLCRKNSLGESIYNLCELGKIVVSPKIIEVKK